MRKVVIPILLLLVFSLTSISAVANVELKKELERASYYAQEYDSGNINYAQLLTKVASVQSEVSSILSDPAQAQDPQVKQILGTPEKTNWVLDEKTNSEKQVETPADIWKGVTYDGTTVRINRKIIPTSSEQGGGTVIAHKAEFSVDVQESPIINFKNKIDDVQKLAKTLNLNPTDIQTANELAKETATLQNLFNNYASKNPEKCQDLMNNILGEENIKSDQRIITQEYEIDNNNGIKTVAQVEMCDNCQNQGTDVWSWINVNINMIKDGKTLAYPVKPTETVEQFKTLDDNEIKKNLIDAMKILKELLQAENYRAASLVAQRIKIINDAWTEKSNDVWNIVKTEADPLKAGSDLKEKAFGEKKQFYGSLFEGYALKSSYVEQQEYEKNLVQDFNTGGEEICNNRIDDNNNGKIDCLDELCSGKVCGTVTLNATVENQTIQKVKELYCISQICQMKKEEPIVENKTVCGNKICEENETKTCPDDCKICPTYPPIECSGKVIFKGTDANGCPLKPLCMQDQSSCTLSSECPKPLCGIAECIQGECKTTNLAQCNQAQCVEGEQKTQNCESGENIVIEICLNGVWKITGTVCSVPVGGPIQAISETQNNSCQVKTDCKEGYVCSNGECILIPLNSKEITPISPTTFKAKTFTGQAIVITGTGITGILQSTDKTPAQDYVSSTETPTSDSSSGGSLTGIVQTPPNDQNQVTTTPNTPSPETTPTLPKEEKAVFSVKGTCKTTNQETSAILTFTGLGDNFKTASNLQNKYEEKGSDWCKYRLESLIKERKEFENSFNEEYARWFFEDYLPNSAEDWEGKKQAIITLHLKNIENQMETAKMMECAGLKELSEYHLININYNSPFGSLVYNEKVDSVRLAGMTQDVKIISPSMKLIIIPSKEFIKEELKKDMNNYDFPGSVETKAERKRTGGLTSEELQMINNNPQLLAKMKELSQNYQDGYLNVQISITDGEDIVYNLYTKINEKEIKVQPLPTKDVLRKDAEVTIPFDSIYNVLKKSMESSYVLYAPWDTSIRPIEQAKTITNLISIWLKTRNMMSSITVSPPRLETDVKDLFKEFFYIVQEDKTNKEVSQDTAQTQVITWNSKGETQITNLN